MAGERKADFRKDPEGADGNEIQRPSRAHTAPFLRLQLRGDRPDHGNRREDGKIATFRRAPAFARAARRASSENDPMKKLPPDQLMHLVLDGEATAEEGRELESLLAADPVAMRRFVELKALFEELSHVPRQSPPPALIERIHFHTNQLFDKLRVSTKRPDYSQQERIAMNQKITNDEITLTNQPALRTHNKKRVIVGATIAAVALIAAGSYFFDIPPGGENAT